MLFESLETCLGDIVVSQCQVRRSRQSVLGCCLIVSETPLLRKMVLRMVNHRLFQEGLEVARVLNLVSIESALSSYLSFIFGRPRRLILFTLFLWFQDKRQLQRHPSLLILQDFTQQYLWSFLNYCWLFRLISNFFFLFFNLNFFCYLSYPWLTVL